MRRLNSFTDEQLLMELVRRNGFQKAPQRVEYCGDGWISCTVGIGRDTSVAITMDLDDFTDLAVLALVGRDYDRRFKLRVGTGDGSTGFMGGAGIHP